MNLVIINNGGANMNSLIYALERLNVEPELTTDPRTVRNASHVILPGVGHATDSMKRLNELNAKELIEGLTQPVLGICLGMQLMYDSSEEGDTRCLGVLSGRVSKMDGSVQRPAPHMGWNQIRVERQHDLLTDIDPDSYFYFVHGYCAEVNQHTVASSDYGYAFSAIAGRDNFIGVQFHPERSGRAGAKLLNNFVNLS